VLRRGWYLTGDLARRDADGYFWFVGRADDVIKSAGHLIGPFEVESALMEHPAVAEAGVIGKPDPVAGEVVKAFVALKPGFEAERGAALELLGHARKRLGAAVAPKEIDFRANAAAHAQRQDHAPAAQGPRAGPARGRHLDAGGSDDERPRAEGALATRPTRSHLDRAHRPALLLADMLRIRRFEERCAELYGRAEDPRLPAPLHRRGGGGRRRAARAGADDNVVATYREHGHALVRGVPMNAIMAEMFGKAKAAARGRGGSMHLFDAATASSAATPSSAAACRWRSASRWPTRCRARGASPPASSARARWPRAPSTSR
jgi:hypothetical protein